MLVPTYMIIELLLNLFSCADFTAQANHVTLVNFYECQVKNPSRCRYGKERYAQL